VNFVYKSKLSHFFSQQHALTREKSWKSACEIGCASDAMAGSKTNEQNFDYYFFCLQIKQKISIQYPPGYL
jgi:phage terminase large subunit-like protein